MIQIEEKDVIAAGSKMGLSQIQAEELYQILANQQEPASKFDTSNVLYYLGAMVVISAFSWFLGIGWMVFGGSGIALIASCYAAIFVLIGHYLWSRKQLYTPGGLFITIAVCLVPLIVYGIQEASGVWLGSDPGQYSGFFEWISGGWFAMEIATLIAGAIAFYFYPFPFLTAPIFFVLWFMSMDITPLLFGNSDDTWNQRLWVSLIFGLGILSVAFAIDQRTKKDFAFWGYFFGMLAFWTGLTLLDTGNEWQRFSYFVINLVLIGIAIVLQRRIFLIFGALGIFGYIGWLSQEIFKDSILFPLVLSLAGVLLILLGIFFQKNQAQITQALLNFLPEGLKKHLPSFRK